MSDPISGSNAAAQPIPPRYWWLKRLTIAAAIYLVALVGLRLWWGYEADRRLNAKIAEYRAAGQPVLLEDFATEAIPDEENAAYYLKQAAAVSIELNDWELAGQMRSIARNPTQSAAFAARVEGLLADGWEVLALVRKARELDNASWEVPIPLRRTDALPPTSTSGQVYVAQRLYLGVLARHRSGDDGWAVAALRDLIALAHHVAPIDFYQGMQAQTHATDAVEDIASGLRVGDRGGGAVGAPEVHALIAELMDERALLAAGERMMLRERMQQIESSMRSAGHPRSIASMIEQMITVLRTRASWTEVTLSEPIFTLDQLEVLARATAYVDAIRHENWPAAIARLPSRAGLVGIDECLHHYSRYDVGLPDLKLEYAFDCRCRRRFAVTALAIRLYECDHGHRPATLDRLVPQYLPAVPADPFDGSGGPLRYLPLEPYPRLYSVGRDGVDDDGMCQISTWDGSATGDVLDAAYFLDRERPAPGSVVPGRVASSALPAATSPSSQAVDDEDNVQHAERHKEHD